MIARRLGGVLALHGPPHHPGYCGQLERQNREHRAWLTVLGVPTPHALVAAAERMRHALNALWPRRTLGWLTSEVLWKQRQQPIAIDRSALCIEVFERAERIRAEQPKLAGYGTAERFAIEYALKERGLLNVQLAGRC